NVRARFDVGAGFHPRGGGDLRAVRDKATAVRVLAVAQHAALVVFDVDVILAHSVLPKGRRDRTVGTTTFPASLFLLDTPSWATPRCGACGPSVFPLRTPRGTRVSVVRDSVGSMPRTTLSAAEARRIALAAQGLGGA